MTEKITCINGDVLKWARLQCCDLQLKSISEILTKIEAWENGDDYPTYAQLEKLAHAYKKPLAVFFFPQPPEGIAYQAEFRTASNFEISHLSYKVTRLINDALVMQINLQELISEQHTKESILHNKLKEVEAQKLAKVTRDYLEVPIEQQMKIKTAKEMLEIWRDAFYKQGIYIFKEAFYDENISGFCIYDGCFPIIYINNSMSFTRQIFTLFHELYHLIHETGGIDKLCDSMDGTLSKGQQNIEKMCNKFAADFLLPENILNNQIGNTQVSYKLVCELADKFHVSKEAMILRLIDLGRVDWNFYNENTSDIYIDFMRVKPKTKGGNQNNTLISYLGRNYLKLAFSAYRENRIDAFQLASYTKTRVSNIPALEKAWGWKV